MQPVERHQSETQHHETMRRAVVPVGHGGVRRDYPRERLMQLRAELPHRRLQYAWPFAGERLAASCPEHLRQFESR